MGFYNVVKPCVVGKLHYARPTTAPIEVDDKVAAPLVESGELTVYGPFSGVVDLKGSVFGEAIEPELGVGFIEEYGDPVEVEDEKPVSRRRSGGRRGAED